MSIPRRLLHKLMHVIQPNRGEADLDREVSAHLLLLEEEYRRRGQPAEEARRSARLMLGGVTQTKELHREARSLAWLDESRRNAVYAVRMLRRRPVLTMAAVLSLALGIGLNAAIFSVTDWVLLRPLPYPGAHELIRVFTAGTAPLTSPSALTYGEFLAFAKATSFRSAAAWSSATRVMSAAGIESVHVGVARICGDLFGVLGVRPIAGRAFSAGEMSSGAPVVVLSHDLWMRAFLGDPAAVGRTVKVDGAPHTVIGVMPARLGYPSGAELWRPLTAAEREDDDRELDMLARLKGGAGAAGASTEIATLVRAGSHDTRTAWGEELQRTSVANVKAALQALSAAAALILLIVCANVAALVSAGGADRAEEIVIRGALGASRARILGQFAAEGLILAVGGGALGILIGLWGLRFLTGIAPASVPRLAEIALDFRIAGVGFAAALLTGLAVGLAPAIRLSRLAAGPGPNHHSTSRVTRRSNGRRALVMMQVAMAVVLTAGASLLAQSLHRLVAIDNGFAADKLIAVDLYLRGVFDGDSQRLFEGLASAAKSVPGVSSVAVSGGVPTRVIGLRATVQVAGDARTTRQMTWRPVSAGYFETAGIPVVAGRAITGSDTARAPRIAVVNRAFLRSLPIEGGAVGARITTSFGKEPLTIVGVSGDTTPAGEADRPAVYVPIDQSPMGGGNLLIRTAGDPRAVIPELTARLRRVAPELAMDRVHRVAERLEAGRAVIRFTTLLAATFAGLALLLSAIGVYGLVAAEVSARWRELAVRLAVGASHGGAVWAVIRPCAAILGGGAGIGVLGALTAGPALQSLMHGVRPADTYTMMFAPAILGVVGLISALLAAARVLRADPAATLREQ
jgi:predicted permease